MLQKLLKCSVTPAIVMVVLHTQAHAIPPPQLVLEDTLVLGAAITTVSLDTTHFALPTLLVGTLRSGDGLASVLRIDTAPLRIADTIYRNYYVPTIVTAALLDGDTHVDYLVSLMSSYPDTAFFQALISLTGANHILADSIEFSRTLKAVAADDSSHDIWVGYVNDTTFTEDGWQSYVGQCNGAVVHLAGLGGSRTTVSSDFAALDLHVMSPDGVSGQSLFAIWYDYTILCTPGYSGPAPDPVYRYAGLAVANLQDSVLSKTTWRTEGEPQACSGLGADVRFLTPLPLADLDGDGKTEVVFYSDGYTLFYDQGSFRLGVYSILTGQPLWTRPALHTLWRATVPSFLWDVDGDGLLDVLAVRIQPTAISTFKGSTGDSLFVAPVDNRFQVHSTPTGPLGPGGVWRGVLYNRDTLFLFGLAEPTSVGDGDVRPTVFELHPNYPNPFNASTRITYKLERPTDVSLRIYDALGRRVETLAAGLETAGEHSLTWAPEARGSGVYFLVLETPEGRQVQKALLLK